MHNNQEKEIIEFSQQFYKKILTNLFTEKFSAKWS